MFLELVFILQVLFTFCFRLIISHLNQKGQDAVIVKSGRRLCGTGGALSNVPIIQNKAYFEVKIQANGVWGVGLATRKVDLNKIPLGNDSESWVLRNDGSIFHNNISKFTTDENIDEGDIIVIKFE
jgi:hypothetical protein